MHDAWATLTTERKDTNEYFGIAGNKRVLAKMNEKRKVELDVFVNR